MSAATTAGLGVPRSRALRSTLGNASTFIALVTVLSIVVCAVAVPRFGSASNIRALFLSVALTGIAAAGLSLVTIVGRVFALSTAAMVALATIVFAYSLQFGPWPALLITVAFGLVAGAVQGIVVGPLQTDPIITTIAFAAILQGIGQLITSGRTIVGSGDSGVFNQNLFGVLPFQVLAFVVVTIGLFLWQRYSIAGRRISLVGLNEKASLISGLRAWPSVLLSFCVFGAMTGLAGGLLAAQSGQGNLLLGGTFGFDVVVAVVVGGIRVKGGVGNPLNAAVGALFVGLLGNVLVLAGLSYETQLVVKGVLVMLAVALMGLSARSAGGRQ